ncbi:MAG: hypothetical protein KDB27_18305 [Planctomycetales bacterium]|nr:hypothetical protein [Planctomycetales bacterium]
MTCNPFRRPPIRTLCVCALTLLAGMELEAGEIVFAADGRGLRRFNDSPALVLSFMAVKQGTEDRTILHFEMPQPQSDVDKVWLTLPIRNIDFEDARLGIYEFAGDGEVSSDEWDIGTLLVEETAPPGGSLVTVDVTNSFRDHLLNSDQFASFNLRALNSSRLDFGSGFTFERPFLYVVPEPSTAVWPLMVTLVALFRER